MIVVVISVVRPGQRVGDRREGQPTEKTTVLVVFLGCTEWGLGLGAGGWGPLMDTPPYSAD